MYHVTGEVQAEFCLKHVGHKQENAAFNRISKEMRTTITAKLSQGVSMNSLMDYIRDNEREHMDECRHSAWGCHHPRVRVIPVPAMEADFSSDNGNRHKGMKLDDYLRDMDFK